MPGTTQLLWTLLRNRTLSADALRALQEKKLAALVRHAFQNVPYYTSLFDSARIRPEDIRSVDDLRRVPISDKNALLAAGLDQLLAKGVDPAACRIERTGGTGGKLFSVYQDPCDVRIRSLVRLRATIVAGRRPRDLLCQLVTVLHYEKNLYRRLGLYRTVQVSHTQPLEHQARELHQTRPDMLHAAPTYLRALLHHLDYRLSRVARPRAVITSGEALGPSLARRLQADLPIELFNFYVAAEVGEIAADCHAHEGLHVHADEVMVEIVREDGSPTESGEEGSVVVTSLSGYAMPFVRYRLGDRAAMLGRPCSCGISFPLISAPKGRQDDVVRLPNGAILSCFPLAQVVASLEAVDDFRFTQVRLDRIVLQIMLWKTLDPNFLSAAQTKMQTYLREPVELEIQIVDAIPEQKLKFRRFVSLLGETETSPEDVR